MPHLKSKNAVLNEPYTNLALPSGKVNPRDILVLSKQALYKQCKERIVRLTQKDLSSQEIKKIKLLETVAYFEVFTRRLLSHVFKMQHASAIHDTLETPTK